MSEDCAATFSGNRDCDFDIANPARPELLDLATQLVVARQFDG
jgi:hypothetical protein